MHCTFDEKNPFLFIKQRIKSKEIQNVSVYLFDDFVLSKCFHIIYECVCESSSYFFFHLYFSATRSQSVLCDYFYGSVNPYEVFMSRITGIRGNDDFDVMGTKFRIYFICIL